MTNEELRAAALAAAVRTAGPGATPSYVLNVALAYEKYIDLGQITDVQEWA